MRLIEKFSKSIEVLNDYRNMYHAETSGTEKHEVAIAINEILSKFCELIENEAEPVVHAHWHRISDGAELQLTCSNCRYDYIEAAPIVQKNINFTLTVEQKWMRKNARHKRT